MGLDRRGDTIVLRGGGEKLLGGILFALFPLIFLILATTPSDTGTRVFGGIGFALTGTIWVRWLRAGIRAEPDFLVLRTQFRTRYLPWSDVLGADVVPTNMNRIFGIVRVTMRSGRTVKVDGVGNRWRRTGMDGSPVGQMAAEINRRLGRT